MRAAIAKPTYGLAALHISGSPVTWALHNLGLGETLGDCLLTTANNLTWGHEADRWITIIGDPTLRLEMFQPPSGLTATLSQGTVNLSWASGGASTFNIYRSQSTSGPFTWVANVTGTSTAVADDISNRVYMVRGVQIVQSGCGTYNNLSLGTIATAH